MFYLVSYKDKKNENFYQVGIVSYGYKACGTHRPGIYTKVAHFLPWIMENMRP